jgi:hypothetical protein
MHPYEAAIDFLLKHVLRHGDGVAAPAAQKHLEAIAALKELDDDPETPAAEPVPGAPTITKIVDGILAVRDAGGVAPAVLSAAVPAPDQAPAK